MIDEKILKIAVDEALVWLAAHPHRDHIDAAFMIAAGTATRTSAGSMFATGLWPTFVEAVKSACTMQPTRA